MKSWIFRSSIWLFTIGTRTCCFVFIVDIRFREILFFFFSLLKKISHHFPPSGFCHYISIVLEILFNLVIVLITIDDYICSEQKGREIIYAVEKWSKYPLMAKNKIGNKKIELLLHVFSTKYWKFQIRWKHFNDCIETIDLSYKGTWQRIICTFVEFKHFCDGKNNING